MREILFRGKAACGAWVQGDLIHRKIWQSEFEVIRVDDSGFDNYQEYEVATDTIGQYTGLTDKNGKKIFEGDIVLFEDECPNNYEYHDCTEMRCGEMRFDDGEFYLTNRIAVEMGDLIYDGKLDGEIIGNIHDNPELLEVK